MTTAPATHRQINFVPLPELLEENRCVEAAGDARPPVCFALVKISSKMKISPKSSRDASSEASTAKLAQ
ncbi:hypothetical protein NECAME_02119 [Necator americanus]|uniref:Uncharacterized protein n=1 Tax=Necator americanus TaxID=51031 RepID=W2TIN1_NECAM|nr:hypothetical protein NECAME_02119 [Necator americanus]ETN81439.1 hypothetical protein NECAME_02119 [Necator americanus]